MLSPFEFLDDVYQQVKLHPKQARSIYEKARDNILSNHRDAVDCAAALFDAATSFYKRLPMNAEWQVLNDFRLCSDNALPSNDETRQRRAVLSLVAIWSAEIVRHYGVTMHPSSAISLDELERQEQWCGDNLGFEAAKSHNSKYDVEWRTEKQRSEHRKKAARGRQAGSGSQEKGHSLEEDAGGISSFEKQVSCSSALYQDVQSEINPRVDLGHEWDGEASWAAHGPQSHFDFRGKAEGTGDGGSQLGCCINHDQRSCPTKVTNAGFMADDFSRCQIIHDQGNATGDKTRSRRANLDALDLPTDTTSQRQDHHDASLDLAICRRHLDLVKAYTDRVRGDFDDQSEHQVRKAWLRLTTQWAKIYAGPGSALGHRDSVTESDADVVYTSSQEFLRLSRQDKVFSKPVVIKENFADAGIFTLNEFVRALGHSTTESIDVSAFIQMLQAEAAPEPGSRNYGLNALDFHGITSCSRPAFTHLLRYRLLETLSEAAIKGGPGKRISRGGRPVPFDITGSLSFNILGLDGAFSPPHMDALTGT
ncbi:hypothetical protein Q7P37_009983 [Cladosporium fusiforme]